MKVGLTIFATDRAISPVELAREAEARGFSSLYLPEHTHIPTSRRTPPPTGEATLAGDLDAAEDEAAPRHERMDVEAVADPERHGRRLESRPRPVN